MEEDPQTRRQLTRLYSRARSGKASASEPFGKAFAKGRVAHGGPPSIRRSPMWIGRPAKERCPSSGPNRWRAGISLPSARRTPAATALLDDQVGNFYPPEMVSLGLRGQQGPGSPPCKGRDPIACGPRATAGPFRRFKQAETGLPGAGPRASPMMPPHNTRRSRARGWPLPSPPMAGVGRNSHADLVALPLVTQRRHRAGARAPAAARDEQVHLKY